MKTRIFGYDDHYGKWVELDQAGDLDGYREIELFVDAGDAQIYEEFFHSLEKRLLDLPPWLQKFTLDTRDRLKKQNK